MELKHSAIAIIACNDLDESQAFHERLGFAVASRYDAEGGEDPFALSWRAPSCEPTATC